MDKVLAARIASFLSVFLIPPVALGAVGRTPGSADVSQSGETTYSIPIFAPPGTHGMTPKLALVYGHRSGRTLVGAGWDISGLSSIARCPKIWATDGEARDVRNDMSDRFCLNGNKLRLTSGTYGNTGATYQTEIETFARVTSLGTAGNGPASFLVEGKDGYQRCSRCRNGRLPQAQDLASYDVEDLARLRNELQISVQTRIGKTVELGADYGHNARLAEEQQLLKSIEKHLKDR